MDPVFLTGRAGRSAPQKALVKITISVDGEVIDAEYLKGHPSLKAAAEESAYGWKFEPILSKGEPVVVESVLTFRVGR